MNKTFVLPILALFVIASLAMVSAYDTVVSGTVYDVTNNYDIVPDAYVQVTCNGNTLNETARSDGTYWITFVDETCPIGSTLAIGDIYAKKGNLEGYNKDPISVHDVDEYIPMNIDLGFAPGGDVFLIPEFGLLIGSLTLLSAVGIFFLVRKK